MNNKFLDFIDSKKAQDVIITAFLLALLYLLQLVVFFGVGGRDDSYITYWSAYSLSELGEIVNYNGDRIEQSSSLLQVLLLALFHKFSGLSIPTVGIIFSSVCGVVTALLAGKLAQKCGVTFYKWAPYLIIFVPYFSYWSSSGMETSLVALCVMFFLITLKDFLDDPFSKQKFLCVSLGIALYILVRPESILVLLAFFVLLLIFEVLKSSASAKHAAVKKITALILTALVIFLSLAAWRYSYFGHIFPQPVYAKTDLVHWADRFVQGLRYLQYALNFSTVLLVLLALAGIAEIFRKNKSSVWMPSVIFLLAYLAFVIFVGGDWMEGRRLLVPIFPILCVLAMAAMCNKRIACVLMILFFSLALIDSWSFSKRESIGLPLAQAVKLSYLAGQMKPDDTKMLEYGFSPFDQFNSSHLRDMLTIPAFDTLLSSLQKENDEPVYITSRQMGMIPYYLAIKHYKKIRFIDMRGLVTRDINDCPWITSEKPKASSGFLMTTRYYLQNQAQIDTECSLPRVDVIYDTGLMNSSADETNAVLNANGYRVYYLQRSDVVGAFSQYVGVDNKYKEL